MAGSVCRDRVEDVVEVRNQFIITRRRRPDRECSLNTAVDVIKFMRKVILSEKYDSTSDLLNVVAYHGRVLCEAEPEELTIRNAVLMTQKLIREENSKIIIGTDDIVSPYDSLNKLWKENDVSGAANVKKLKKSLLEAVKEVAAEMESCRESIASQAINIIQPQDVIIVHSLKNSSTLQDFLNSARKSRKHRVLSIVHSSDFDASPDFVTPIELDSVPGKMCEVTKVVLPGVAVFPDGSCLAPAGSLSICLAAQRHSVPVYFLAAFYKITPFFISDSCMVNPQLAPNLPFSLARKFTGKVQVLKPAFDFIPASLVSMFVSNSACILPSHVYRLIGDYYHPEDVAEC